MWWADHDHSEELGVGNDEGVGDGAVLTDKVYPALVGMVPGMIQAVAILCRLIR